MKRLIACLLVLLIPILAGCSANKAADNDLAAYAAPAEEGLSYRYDTDYAMVPETNEPSALDGQKLIRKIRLTAETEDYAEFMSRLSAAVDALGGYWNP